MKKHIKEIAILFIKLLAIYILPLIASTISKDSTIFVLFFNIIISFILSVIFSYISNSKIKYFYPLFVALIFIPTIYIYYNDSAYIYLVFHFVFSFLGIFHGLLLINNKKKFKT